jgi:hypothetical protein
MKCLTLLKNWSETLHGLASRLHRCQYDINPCRNYRNYGNNVFFWKLPMEFIASTLLCNDIVFVKALRQWRQIREAMKWWNVNYGKKFKQWSDEAFHAGKELKRWSVKCWQRIEAMKHLTLHRIASSLHSFCCPALLKTPWKRGQNWADHGTLRSSWKLVQLG